MIYQEYEERVKELKYPDRKGLPKVEFGARWRSYKEAEDKIHMEFKEALAREYGISGHKNEPKVWQMAWNEGHSAGYQEIENWYADLAELLK